MQLTLEEPLAPEMSGLLMKMTCRGQNNPTQRISDGLL